MILKCVPPALMLAFLAACTDVPAHEAQPNLATGINVVAFQGSDAGQAEMGLESLGYELTRSEGLTGYWFNDRSGACAQIVTDDGRYASVEMLPSDSC